MKILALTVFCMDIYVKQNIIMPGGNSLNFITQCAKLGINDVGIIGAVGNDDYSKIIFNHLNKYIINMKHLYIKNGCTASNKIYINENGDRYFLPDSWNGGVYEKFLLNEEDWLYLKDFDIIATTYHDPNINEVLKRKSNNQKLVMDFLDIKDVDIMKKLMVKNDISFVSGTQELTESLKSYSQDIKGIIVITLGENGSIALKNGKEYYNPAIKVDKVIDTTGCGDAYQAAFTVSYFSNNDILTAMNEGAIASSKILDHFGGI